MSQTDLIPVEEVLAVDVVFDLTRSPEVRGKALQLICLDEAERQITLEEVSKLVAWAYGGPIVAEQNRRKAKRHEAVQTRALRLLEKLEEATLIGSAMQCLKVEREGNGWQDDEGNWHTLNIDMQSAMPENMESGRNRAVRRFLKPTRRGPSTISVLRDAGVSDEKIAAIRRPGKESLLGETSIAVNAVKDQHLPREREVQELKWVVDQATECDTIQGFVDTCRERHNPGEQSEKATYSLRVMGEAARLVLEMSRDLHEKVIWPRLADRLKQAPTELIPSLSLASVKEAQDTGDFDRLFRIAIASSYTIEICHELLQNNDFVYPDTIVSITESIGMLLTHQQVMGALEELRQAGLARRDGKKWSRKEKV